MTDLEIIALLILIVSTTVSICLLAFVGERVFVRKFGRKKR